MEDLAHIKVREKEWATGPGMRFGIFCQVTRQEEVAKNSLKKTINSQGMPECYRDIWE